jgi:hypothetical protein
VSIGTNTDCLRAISAVRDNVETDRLSTISLSNFGSTDIDIANIAIAAVSAPTVANILVFGFWSGEKHFLAIGL